MRVSDLKMASSRVALLISIYFPPEPGGGATTALNRALILSKIGYTVFVLCGFPSYPTGRIAEKKYRRKLFYIEKMDKFTLIRLRLLPLASKGLVRRLILFMNFVLLGLLLILPVLRASPKIELVYALAPIMFSSPIGFIYAKVTKSFFIYEVSDFWPEALVALRTKLNFIPLFFGKIFASISYSLPDMLVVISNSAGNFLVKNYQPKVLVYAMPIGADTDRLNPRSKDSSREELIKNKIMPAEMKKNFIILYAGVITKITKVEYLISAANVLKDHEIDISFLIIGRGEEKERLEEIKLVNKLDNLLFLDFQPGDLVPYIISAADVCVVPLSYQQIYETTIPTKFFDYLACHKPQIGICGGELAEIIDSNQIGITVKQGEVDKLVNSILELKNSKSLLCDMEENAKRVLELYSLDTLSLKFNNILQKEIELKKNKRKH